ncbi:hypothetical protein PHISCL_10122 [Aspergillus sclerotialis]|uniref:Uncharacterized protein n=1 Tax=Aspergillus sclerotialis TaxID=2070753 RepID=A0A3A2Z394_9EURO|nr:hypothetical protein PHISCL_10122 [Aspergillus sclerotialis]
MSVFLKTASHSHNERIARIIWAAHMLFYLTNTQSHNRQPQDTKNNGECDDRDTNEPSDNETDYETERAVILSGSRTPIRRKFLDCIAQLLSPCKGWNGVTATAIREGEDGVEVDVARNDGFFSRGDRADSAVITYCTRLEGYLAGCDEGSTEVTATSPEEFELKAINFARRRVDYWIEDLREVLKHHLNSTKSTDGLPQSSPRQEDANTWMTIKDLILQSCPNQCATRYRVLVVQQAYKCVNTPEIQQTLSDNFGAQIATKLWTKLNFLARPLADCRLLASIVTREPHFRNCKIVPIPPKPKTTLEPKYMIEIFTAWEQIGLESPPKCVIQKLDRFNKEFKTTCAEAFSLHAEMQLVLHYEEKLAPPPTLDYFGCSKKTCLLCEIVLDTLPSPVSTRGRHGVCYPAWGVPNSGADTIQLAVQRLETSLVDRIGGFLGGLMHPRRKGQAVNTMQSGFVSDLSRLTLEELQKRENDVQSFKSKQAVHRNELMIR